MRIAVIHSGNAGFFPRFYKSLKDAIENSGNECILFSQNSGRNNRNRLQNQITWGSRFNWAHHFYLYKLTGMQDIFSWYSTYDLINKLKCYKPNIIHLHIVNAFFINIPMLVKFLNKEHIPVVWTFHDCRAFTGGCSYFDEVNCFKWRNGCTQCTQSAELCYPFFSNTSLNWINRNRWHNAIKNLVIVTPSQWLANFVAESMLKDKQCTVIYNGVDTNAFYSKSSCNVFDKYNIPYSKKIVLGCAINWDARKGLEFFNIIENKLPDDYQIVLVGNISQKQKATIKSDKILCVGRTSTFDELIAWYQQATVFVNPTLADNFPTTNIESLAAGTPVVTFRTGGSPEAIDDKTGIVVEQGNVEKLIEAIVSIVERPDLYTSYNCIERSKMFSNEQYKEYVKIYNILTAKEKL